MSEKKRKTYTSPEVKNRWNRKHYDRMHIICRKGGADAIKELAKSKGMSMSGYIVWLIQQDAVKSDRQDVAELLGGGG